MEIRLNALIMMAAMVVAFWQWLRIGRPRNGVFDLLGIVLSIAIPLEIYGYFTNMYVINNSPAYNWFGLVESGLVLAMVRTLRPQWTRWIVIGAGVIGISFLMNAWANPAFDLLFFETILVISLVLSLFCMALLWSVAQATQEPLARLPLFWLFLGFLIYYAGMVPLMGSFYFVFRQDQEMAASLFSIMNVISIVRYLFTAYACSVATRRLQQPIHG